MPGLSSLFVVLFFDPTRRRRGCGYPSRWYVESVRIDIPIFDGVDELDAVGSLEVFRSAGAMGAPIDARLVVRTDEVEVRGAYGLRLRSDDFFVSGEADIIVVPGGGWASRSEEGVWAQVQRGEWLALLRDARATASLMCGVCTGTLLLAHAGLVTKRRANTHHLAQDDLCALDVIIVDEKVVDDGDVVTSGGVTSGIDLALWIVEREVSKEVADRVARRMEYDRFRPLVS
jgi:transcriptional regulator GlxA family with amidase domain